MRQVVLLYRLDYATFELPSCWSPKHQRVFCTKHLSLTFVTCSCLCLCLAHHLWQKCLCFPLGPLNGFLVLFCLFLSFTLFFFFLYGGKKKGRVALISQCSAFSLPLLYTVTILCVNFVKGHVLFCGTCSGHTVVSQVLVINVLWKRTNMTVRYFQHLIKEHFTNNTAAVLLLLC